MTLTHILLSIVLLAVLTLAAYVDRIYSEMGKFLAREYQDNIDAWEQVIEPRLHLGRESIALSASVLRQLSIAAIALLFGLRLATSPALTHPFGLVPQLSDVFRTLAELVLLILVFDRLVPQILFSRTRGLWIARVRYPFEALLYLILPITLLIGLLLSIAALAEPEDHPEDDSPSEAMDALLEAGEEEGILEESDRELVRSVIEFGDKVVREVMTPRPEIFAVPDTLTLEQFTIAIQESAFSRVPVYSGSLDHITGIAFARDLLHIADTDARTITVATLQRPAAFVPETKMVAELLREMQSEKQHMRIVIDEYGGVAGLVTIEDLLEAIVGSIADEHDEPEDLDEPIPEPGGSFLVPGTFEISRLRDLFTEPPDPRTPEDSEPHDDEPGREEFTPAAPDMRRPGSPQSEPLGLEPLNPENPSNSSDSRTDPRAEARPEARTDSRNDTRTDSRRSGHTEPLTLHLPEHYESTTVGGLVSELAGHIPLPGEVVEQDGLRLEVLASTDRRIDRIRISLVPHPEP